MSPVIDTLNRLARLIIEKPGEAANELDRMAERFRQLASQLRSRAACRDDSGIGDRVQIKLIGPDGTVKQVVDTASH